MPRSRSGTAAQLRRTRRRAQQAQEVSGQARGSWLDRAGETPLGKRLYTAFRVVGMSAWMSMIGAAAVPLVALLLGLGEQAVNWAALGGKAVGAGLGAALARSFHPGPPVLVALVLHCGFAASGWWGWTSLVAAWAAAVGVMEWLNRPFGAARVSR